MLLLDLAQYTIEESSRPVTAECGRSIFKHMAESDGTLIPEMLRLMYMHDRFTALHLLQHPSQQGASSGQP